MLTTRSRSHSPRNSASPNMEDWPKLSEALMFGPLLPPRYRLSGPGAMDGAADLFTEQLSASPRAPIDPADLEALPTFSLGGALARQQ